MVVKEVYPQLNKQSRIFLTIRNIARVLFVLAGIVCMVVNYMTGGKQWSLVVVWALITAWNVLFSPDRFEFNAISQTVKVIFFTVVLLWLIDLCLVKAGWYKFVIPIVCFGALILTGVFLLIDIKAQSHNSMPMIWLIVFSLGFTVFLMVKGENRWPVIVLASVAVGLLCLSMFYHEEFINELKKRFHTN